MQPLARVVLCAVFVSVAPVVLHAQQPTAEDPVPPKPAITVSKETTRLTTPLRDDGYVDYLTALNEQSGRGVTPKNNAAALLWRALGPAAFDEDLRGPYSKVLGPPKPPDGGSCFVNYGRFVEDRGDKKAGEDPDEQYDRARDGPWSAKDCPAVAEWLVANRASLELVVEASQRARYFVPLVSNDDNTPLIAALLPMLGHARNTARALLARAMHALEQGDLDAACADLAACHRLGRLIGQGPTLIDVLVAYAIDSMACHGDAALAVSGKLSAEQAAAYRARLEALPPLPNAVGAIDVSERYMFLDCVAGLARSGPAALSALDGGGDGSQFSQALLKAMTDTMIDWDEILRLGNRWYDRMVEAARKPTRSERKEAWQKIEEDLNERAKKGRNSKAFLLDVFTGKSPRKLMTKQVGTILIAMLTPALGAVTQSEERACMRFDVTRVALALAAHHADKGDFPEKLADLKPAYLDEVPGDRFSDTGLIYRPAGDGYVLYSIGPNEEDDAGRGRYDPRPDDAPVQDWDDIAVRK